MEVVLPKEYLELLEGVREDMQLKNLVVEVLLVKAMLVVLQTQPQEVLVMAEVVEEKVKLETLMVLVMVGMVQLQI